MTAPSTPSSGAGPSLAAPSSEMSSSSSSSSGLSVVCLSSPFRKSTSWELLMAAHAPPVPNLPSAPSSTTATLPPAAPAPNLAWGMNLSFLHMGKSYPLPGYEPDDFVISVRVGIAAALGLSYGEEVLFSYKSQTFSDLKKLEECGIGDGAVLRAYVF